MNAPSSTPSAKSSTARRSHRRARPKGHYVPSHQPRPPANSSSPSSLDPAETLPARAFLCAIIEQAWIDIQPTDPIASAFKEMERQLDRHSALRFFHSPEFDILCAALRLNTEAILSAVDRLTPAPQQ